MLLVHNLFKVISFISFIDHFLLGVELILNAFKNHILTKKSKKRKLKLTHSSLVSDSDLGSIKKQLRLK